MVTASERLRTLRRHLENVGIAGTTLYVAQKARLALSRAHPPYVRLRSKHAHHPLWARPGTTDIDVYCQIFRDREYECLDDVVEPGLIIDCGANVGYSAASFLSRFPRARVLAIEPDAGNFTALQRNVQPFGERCELFNTGIWSASVGLVMDEANPDDRAWTRTVRPVKPGEEPTMQAMDIGTLFERSGFARISILKIDIEGAEREVFAHDEKRWLPRVDNLVIELHGPSHEKVFRAAIADEGFELSTSWELMVCKRKRSR